MRDDATRIHPEWVRIALNGHLWVVSAMTFTDFARCRGCSETRGPLWVANQVLLSAAKPVVFRDAVHVILINNMSAAALVEDAERRKASPPRTRVAPSQVLNQTRRQRPKSQLNKDTTAF
jgi:hypothetical protein